MTRFFLVRHGASEANVDQSITQRIPDPLVRLTELGAQQAEAAGCKILAYLLQKDAEKALLDRRLSRNSSAPLAKPAGELWYSPYVRAQQTLGAIMSDALFKERSWRRREHALLGEQQFGLFDGLGPEERARLYPNEYACYEKYVSNGLKFYARPPCGESRFDVFVRANAVVQEIMLRVSMHGPADILIVAHGNFLRMFYAALMGQTVDQIEAEPLPPPGSVRVVDSASPSKVYL